MSVEEGQEAKTGVIWSSIIHAINLFSYSQTLDSKKSWLEMKPRSIICRNQQILLNCSFLPLFSPTGPPLLLTQAGRQRMLRTAVINGDDSRSEIRSVLPAQAEQIRLTRSWSVASPHQSRRGDCWQSGGLIKTNVIPVNGRRWSLPTKGSYFERQAIYSNGQLVPWDS